MAICLRYAHNDADAREIVNDGFLKVFREIDAFTPSNHNIEGSLKAWIKTIMIYTAIDHHRANKKYDSHVELTHEVYQQENHTENAIDKMSYQEIIEMIQRISPSYRLVFNLFVIDGFKHEDIARKLNISVGTSKSNLAKARASIQKLFQEERRHYEQRVI
jgi:RNA polymerase sigma-70 factor (ECF subfamily)